MTILSSVRFFLNARDRPVGPGLFSSDEHGDVDAFFRARPQIAPTSLHDLPGLARALGIGRLLIKDESTRLGLNAFKGVGVLYAVTRMREQGRLPADATLVCATQGNHGRAVAHVARTLGLRARVYVPANAVPVRVDALRSEGAEVVRDAGRYDDAVASMRADAEANGWVVVSDTAWPGYDEIPRWIMAGYTRIMSEIAEQLVGEWPAVVIVQAGVGGLACAVASWLQRRSRLIVCEPIAAPCLLETARAGKPIVVPEDETIMTGLCAGRVSATTWQVILSAADAFVAIDDSWAERAIAQLARPVETTDPVVIGGASGAAGLGALMAMLEVEDLQPVRSLVGVDSSTSVLLINTEGATDPALRTRILARDQATRRGLANDRSRR